MRKIIILVSAMILFTPIAYSQDTEEGSLSLFGTAGVNPSNPGTLSSLGDLLWTLDVQSPTTDDRCLGCEFDGTHYWITGAFDFNIAYLYEITPDGVVVNTYPQPVVNWGGWGWRDLAFDGAFLYAGDPNNLGWIEQIDPATGCITGVRYGPWAGGSTLCRALAYDPVSDSFWFASFSSDIYQGFKDGTYNTYSNPGLSIYGMAMDDSNPTKQVLWVWSQDGSTGGLASAMDPDTGTFTGETFNADPAHGTGIAGGACAYLTNSGMEFCGMMQTDYDTIGGYELTKDTLVCDTEWFWASDGANITFDLDAGPGNGDRDYIIFGSISGHSPGFPLPDGGPVVPINWDIFSSILLNINPPGFMGTLDSTGQAIANLQFSGFPLGNDLKMTFAYCLKGKPWDFASNHVEIVAKADPEFTGYRYDDGSSENVFGWIDGGEMCWMHCFDTVPNNDLITGISTAWGSSAYPGYCPGNGTSTTVFLWDDPNNDGNPSDCVLLDYKDTVVQHVDSDILTAVPFDVPVKVNGKFFIGCVLAHSSGQYVAPMDQSTTPYNGEAWVAGNISPGLFDPHTMSNNLVHEMDSIGYPSYFLLRADTEVVPPDHVYVDDDYDSSTQGWQYDHFDTIQDGIDHVTTNGKVTVYEGAYYEKIQVPKKLEIEGAGSANTIIDAGGGGGCVVSISANDVILSGFTIQQGGTGVAVDAEGCTISDNTIQNNGTGLDLDDTRCTTVSMNSVDGNSQVGISMFYTFDSTITCNTINGNSKGGIWLEEAQDNIIDLNEIKFNGDFGMKSVSYNYFEVNRNTYTNNTISDNSTMGLGILNGAIPVPTEDENTVTGNTFANNGEYGMMFYYSSKNTISDNLVTGNGATSSSYQDGIFIQTSVSNLITGNTVTDNEDKGLMLSNSGYNTISDNLFQNNEGHGLELNYAESNTISGNTAESNQSDGISLIDSDKNELKENVLQSNKDYGINLDHECDENRIYHNNFYGNHGGFGNASDWGSNDWYIDYPDGGNYYDDILNPKDDFKDVNQLTTGSDGIVDLGFPTGGLHLYIILNGMNLDKYPLLNPY